MAVAIVYKKTIYWSIIICTATLIISGSKGLFFLPQIIIGTTALLSLFFYSISLGGTFFHPIPFTSLMMIWAFILSPSVSIGLEHYMVRAPKEIDWFYWIYITSWIYTIGSLIFSISAAAASKRIFTTSVCTFKYSKKKLLIYAPIFLILTFSIQIYVFSRFGGIIGYMLSWTEDRTMFEGLGPLLMLAEAFPILFLIFFVLFTDREKIKDRKWIILTLFLVFIILKLIFGGFRGSRSNTIWGLFWFAGIIHLFYFRLKISHFISGILLIIVFMVSYTLYKSFGVNAFSGNYTFEDTGRFDEANPLTAILLGDLSRVGVNSYILQSYFSWDVYKIKYGATYIESLSKITPGLNLLFDGFSKNASGSELLYNIEVNPLLNNYQNSRIFGFYGEGLLNFGPYIPILGFAIVGILIAKLDNQCRKLSKNSVWILSIPFASNLAIMFLLSDSDNLIFFMIKNGFMPVIFLWLISQKNSSQSVFKVF